MPMTPDPRELLASTPLIVDTRPHALGAWRHDQAAAIYAGIRRAERQTTFVISDDREVSALLRESYLEELPAPVSVERGWAVLTLDLTMAWDVVGILALVTGALAARGVPVGAVTAFSRDHVLVPVARVDDALAALDGMFASVERRD